MFKIILVLGFALVAPAWARDSESEKNLRIILEQMNGSVEDFSFQALARLLSEMDFELHHTQALLAGWTKLNSRLKDVRNSRLRQRCADSMRNLGPALARTAAEAMSREVRIPIGEDHVSFGGVDPYRGPARPTQAGANLNPARVGAHVGARGGR